MTYIADRVQETSTSTGTGNFTLGGAVSGYRTFLSALGSSTTRVTYVISDGTNWEVGDGSFNGSTTLTREVIRSSSNGGALVNFPAGTKNVWIDISAEMADNGHHGNVYAISRGWAMP
jgi:hypothetical protein